MRRTPKINRNIPTITRIIPPAPFRAINTLVLENNYCINPYDYEYKSTNKRC